MTRPVKAAKTIDRTVLCEHLRRAERSYLDAGWVKPGSKLALEMSGAAGAIASLRAMLEGGSVYAPKRRRARS